MMNHMSFKDFLLHLALDSISDNHKRGEGYKTPYKGQAFWEYRPFSRLLHWGKDYKTAISYLLQNTLEALGFTPYTPRKENYAYRKHKPSSA